MQVPRHQPITRRAEYPTTPSFQGWLQEPPASPEQLKRIEAKLDQVLDQVLDALALLNPYAPRPGEFERLTGAFDVHDRRGE